MKNFVTKISFDAACTDMVPIRGPESEPIEMTMKVPELNEELGFTKTDIKMFENINLTKQQIASTKQRHTRMLANNEVILKEEMFFSSALQCLIS